MKKITILLILMVFFSASAQECPERLISSENVVTAFLMDGSKYSWGNNEHGELGNNSTNPETEPVPTVMFNSWLDISHGRYHTLALHQDGTIWAWGNNDLGELGIGNTEDKLFPVQVGAESDWIAVSAGLLHSVALKSDGTLWGWGNNQALELENSTVEFYTAPIQISDDTDWEKIHAGYFTIFGIKTDGTLWVRGRSTNGGLGLGGNSTAQNFQQIGTDTWIKVSATSFHHTVALKTDNTLWKWGHDYPGDPNSSISYEPTQVGSDQWKDVAAGYIRTTGIKFDGTLWQWGASYWSLNGELITGSLNPEQIGNENDWESLATTLLSSYAIKENKTLWNWDFAVEAVPQITTTQIMACTELNVPDYNPDNIVFYPNPVQNDLHWISNIHFTAYEIYDVLGKKIQQDKISQNQIDTSKLSNGAYFLVLRNADTNVFRHKFLKK